MKTIKKHNFKAAILFKSKTELHIKEIYTQEYLDYGQILVKMIYSSICGTQIKEIDAIQGRDKYLPHLLGHEGVAKVIEIGPGVQKVKVNDTVVLHWRKGSGIESATPKYFHKGKVINAGYVTTFNEKAIVSENRITKINENIDLSVAPLFGCSLTTGFGIIRNNAILGIGQSILIFGLGNIGIFATLGSQLQSANPIVGIDIDQKKINFAKKYGLDKGFIFNKEIYAQIMKKYPNLFDFVLDTTGNHKIIEMCYNLTKPNGKTILAGVPNIKNKTKLYTLPLHFGKKITGSHGGDTYPDNDINEYISILNKRKINLKKFIFKEFKFTEINNAIKLFRKGVNGKLLLKF